MQFRSNLKRMAVAQWHIACATIANWVIAQVLVHVATVRVAAVRPKIAAQEPFATVLHVYRVAGHCFLALAPNPSIQRTRYAGR